MEKRIKYLILCVVTLMAIGLDSCTRNNGAIGHLFGMWELSEITVDGEPASDYDHNIYWAFQNNIIEFVMTDKQSHNPSRRFGTFDEEDNYIILHLNHKGNGENDYLYNIFPVLRLPCEADVALRKIEDKGNRLVLGYTATDGTEIVYTLKKQ